MEEKQDAALRVSFETHTKFTEARLKYVKTTGEKIKLKEVADKAITLYLKSLS